MSPLFTATATLQLQPLPTLSLSLPSPLLLSSHTYIFCVIILNDTRFFSTSFAVHCCLVWCVGVPQSFFTVHNECDCYNRQSLMSKFRNFELEILFSIVTYNITSPSLSLSKDVNPDNVTRLHEFIDELCRNIHARPCSTSRTPASVSSEY